MSMQSLSDLKQQNTKDHDAIMGKMKLIEEKVNSAGSFSRTMKWAIGISIMIIMYLLKVGNDYQAKSYNLILESESAKIGAYKMIDSINHKMDIFTGTAIMDTLLKVKKDIHLFYVGEWMEETQFTRDVYNNEIHPNTIARRKGQLILKDHEFRIKKLENKLQ